MSAKLFVYVGIIVFALLLTGWQTYLSMAQNSTPHQPYRIVKKEGALEIRFYPPAIEASVQKSGSYNNMMNSGFRDLAGYIFGGNDKGEKIAMTAPVKAEMNDNSNETAKITFIMPEKFEMEKKPNPVSSNIMFSETKPVYAAAITFGGFAGIDKMETYKSQLLAELKKRGLEPEGNVQYLYYNPPFQLFNRRNEVLVQLSNFSE